MANTEYSALIDMARHLRLASDKLDSFLESENGANYVRRDHLLDIQDSIDEIRIELRNMDIDDQPMNLAGLRNKVQDRVAESSGVEKAVAAGVVEMCKRIQNSSKMPHEEKEEVYAAIYDSLPFIEDNGKWKERAYHWIESLYTNFKREVVS